MISDKNQAPAFHFFLVLLAAALLISGCDGNSGPSGDDDDDSASGDDDDSASGDDDDSASGDDDDSASGDDDDSVSDDDDSGGEAVASVSLSVDADSSDTRTPVTFTVVVTYETGDAVTNDGYSFSAVESGTTASFNDEELSSATAGTVDVTAVAGGVSSDPVTVTFTEALVAAGDFVVNELLADGTAGDANGDGTTDGLEDTMVEFVNVSGLELSLEGAGVFERDLTFAARHTFNAADDVVTVGVGEAVVVFGGGEPVAAPLGAHVVAADNASDPGSPFGLHLDPAGDVIELRAADGTAVVSLAWGNEAGGSPDANIDQSINLDPDVTGTDYSPHSDLAGDVTNLFSPGTKVDGSSFGP